MVDLEMYPDADPDGFGTDCVRCGYPFPNKKGSITEPVDHECDSEPLWGEDGPADGQIVSNINGTGIGARWNPAGFWERV